MAYTGLRSVIKNIPTKLVVLRVDGWKFRMEIFHQYPTGMKDKYSTPNDALKHHLHLKTDIIFLQQGVLEWKLHETGLPIHGNFV